MAILVCSLSQTALRGLYLRQRFGQASSPRSLLPLIASAVRQQQVPTKFGPAIEALPPSDFGETALRPGACCSHLVAVPTIIPTGRSRRRKVMDVSHCFIGRRDRDRTCNPQLRRLMLYPIELLARHRWVSFIVASAVPMCASAFQASRLLPATAARMLSAIRSAPPNGQTPAWPAGHPHRADRPDPTGSGIADCPARTPPPRQTP